MEFIPGPPELPHMFEHSTNRTRSFAITMFANHPALHGNVHELRLPIEVMTQGPERLVQSRLARIDEMARHEKG